MTPSDYERTEQGDDPACPTRLTDEQLDWLRRDAAGGRKIADEIQELRARVAKLEAALLVDGAKLLARNARLEAALRPFAEIFSPPMSLASEVAEARAALEDAQ